VTENRLGAAGENRRHPFTLLAESSVPNGVNTSMNAVQALGLHTPGHTPAMNASTLELRQGNDAMLVCGQACDCCLRSSVVTLRTHVGA
jgi:hypothetical protein